MPRQRSDLERNSRQILIPLDTLRALEHHAEKRGLTPGALARLILAEAIDENMIDAILKDVEPPAPTRERSADEYSSLSPGYHDPWGPGGRHG